MDLKPVFSSRVLLLYFYVNDVRVRTAPVP